MYIELNYISYNKKARHAVKSTILFTTLLLNLNKKKDKSDIGVHLTKIYLSTKRTYTYYT